MSTSAMIKIKDQDETITFYRHSDGYPDCTFEDLKGFVEGYKNGTYRLNAMQSASHLVIRGHKEYKKDGILDSMTWKVGAYEVCSIPYDNCEYSYTIDLVEETLTCDCDEVGSYSFKKAV